MRCVRRRGELSGVLPLRLMAPGARGPVPEPGSPYPVPGTRYPIPVPGSRSPSCIQHAPLQHALSTGRRVRPATRWRRAHVCVRSHGVRPRAHRQLPHVPRGGSAASHAASRRRLHGAPRHQLHRRRRQDDRRVAEGRRAAARIHDALHRRLSRGRRRAGTRAARGHAARHRSGEPGRDGRHDRVSRAARPHLPE